MPSLQVVNTGASPANTALGNISAGFIESFNKRQETARNDEIFSKIKSKYGPSASPDTIYKDILQSEGFDQSYKNNILKQVGDYAALQRNQERTVYEQARLTQLEEDLKIRKKKSEEDPATKPLTPYQRETQANRQRYLQIQENKLANSIQAGSGKINKDFANYTNAVLKLSPKPTSPEDKVLLDTVGIQALNGGADIQTAFNQGLQAIAQKKEIQDNAIPPMNPATSRLQSTPQQEQEARESLFDFLFQAYQLGVRDPSKLREIAKRGRWGTEEANPIIQKILQNPNKKTTVSQEQVDRMLFE